MRIWFSLLLMMLPELGLAENSGPVGFEITANGYRYGEFTFTHSENDMGYAIATTAEAQGLFGLMLRAHYDATTTGSILSDGAEQSIVFEARSVRIFKDRSSRVEFVNNAPTNVAISPAKDRTDLSDPAKISTPVIDPLSYLATMVVNPGPNCPKPANLYDGRRLTRISFEKQGDSENSMICAGSYEIIAGPDHTLRKGYRAFEIILDYSLTTDGPLVLNSVDFVSGKNRIVLTQQQN